MISLIAKTYLDRIGDRKGNRMKMEMDLTEHVG
jgi:hypothetical protein